MKKLVLPFFSCLLVFTLLFGSFGSVKAAAGDDPWVTPVSGDMVFTTEIVSISALPGTFMLANQMLAPKGFLAGEAQFGDYGVRISGFDTGKATICFSLRAIEVLQGWGGKVGVWNGTVWVPLSTTIAPVAAEASSTSACAAIKGNGTYAFIKWIAYTDKLPTSRGNCDYDVRMDFVTSITGNVGGYMQGWTTRAYFASEKDISGLPVSVRFLGSIPENQFEMAGTGVGTLSMFFPGVYMVDFVEPLWTRQSTSVEDWESITFNVTFGDCNKVLDAPPIPEGIRLEQAY